MNGRHPRRFLQRSVFLWAAFPILIAGVACSSAAGPSSSAGGSGGSSGNATMPTSGAGGSSGGTSAIGARATLSGTLGGRTLDVVDPFAAKGVDDPTYPERVTIILADLPNLCSFLQTATAANETKADLFDLLIVLGGSTNLAVTAGTYSVSALSVNAQYAIGDAACQQSGAEATAGTVTITSVGASVIGTFDLTLATDHVTGNFDAPFCNVPARSADPGSGDGGLVCVQ
jgi:hypothetical protein